MPEHSRWELRPISAEALTEEVKAEWDALAERFAPGHYKNSRHWYEIHSSRTDENRVIPVAIVKDGETRAYICVDIVPDHIAFTAAERRLFGLPVRVGVVHYPGFSGDPDAVPDAAAWAALIDKLGVDGMHFEFLPEDGALEMLTRNRTELRNAGLIAHNPHGRQIRHLVDDENLVDHFTDRLSSKRWYENRRLIRKMKEEIGEVEVVAVREPTQVESFIADARAISAASWQSRVLGERLHDRFAHAQRGLAEHGMLRTFLLRAGSHPVAFMTGVSYQGVHFLDETAYDPSYRRYSPGMYVAIRAIEATLRREDAWRYADLMYGDGDYKAVFSTSSHPVVDPYLLRATGKIKTAVYAHRMYRAVYKIIMEFVVKTGMKKRLKALLRR